MSRCVLCGEQAAYSGKFVLCGACMQQLRTLKAEDCRYRWYVQAMKRSMEDLFCIGICPTCG